MQWAGHNLEDCTFEEVQVFLKSFVESDGATVDLLVKECRYFYIIYFTVVLIDQLSF